MNLHLQSESVTRTLPISAQQLSGFSLELVRLYTTQGVRNIYRVDLLEHFQRSGHDSSTTARILQQLVSTGVFLRCHHTSGPAICEISPE